MPARTERRYAPARSARLQKKRRKRTFLRLGLALIVACMLFFGAWFFLRLDATTLSNVVVVGTERVSAEKVSASAREALKGSYFLFVPKANAFFFPRRDIEKRLMEEFPDIRVVHAVREDFTTLTLEVAERAPFALWCAQALLPGEEDTRETCYFLDRDGMIYEPAPSFTGTVFFKHLGTIEDGKIIGQAFLPKEEFQRLSSFLDALSLIGLHPVESVLKDREEYEVLLREGGVLRFARDQDFELLLSNLETALSSEEFKAADRSALEYLDLRFGNRVFYKFR